MRKATIESLVLAIMLTAILSGVASAAPPYSVKLKVPNYVTLGRIFKVHAAGASSTPSHLEVFLTNGRCMRSAAAETKHASGVLISKNVFHGYTGSNAVHARLGTHHVCAYLTPTDSRSVTRAHASASYSVLVGGY